jgi:hypothetical protein
MQVIISGRGVVLTPAFKTLVEGKVTKLARVLPRMLDARVVCEAEKFRRTARPAPGRASRRTPATPEPVATEDLVPRRLVAKPMSVDEAVMQLRLGADQFFVFRNAQTSDVNVLYRRRDGGLGLIEPVA